MELYDVGTNQYILVCQSGTLDVGQPRGFYTVGSTLSAAQDNTLLQDADKVSRKGKDKADNERESGFKIYL